MSYTIQSQFILHKIDMLLIIKRSSKFKSMKTCIVMWPPHSYYVTQLINSVFITLIHLNIDTIYNNVGIINLF